MAKVDATVVIDIEKCKGCVLCVKVCPVNVLYMSEDYNQRGYRYPLLKEGCTGCELCAIICPDLCFEVYRGTKKAAV